MILRRTENACADSEKSSMIQTVIVSSIIPFIFTSGFICFLGDISYVIIRCIAGMMLVAVPVLYYFVVMRKRKSDKLLDSHIRRIWLSLRIQAGIMFAAFLIPFGYIVFFTHPENGHWDGAAAAGLLIFGLLEPLIVHLSGYIFDLIFRKLIFKK